MRVSLGQKFMVGSFVVVGLVVAAPALAERSGHPLSPWVLPFLALAAGSTLGFVLSREVGRPIGRVRALTDRIRRGDLSSLPDGTRSPRFPDETFDLACGVVDMVKSLRELIANAQRSAEQISSSTLQLGRSVECVHGATDEISTTLSELSKGAAHQHTLLSDVTRLIHDIASAIELNASRAREAFGFAAEANQKANAGVDVSRLAIEKMRTVFERVEQGGGMVFQLEAKTRHVHQITEIITSVASRTNLLSLNASIEAARAGEAGRGFAVVADEIRKLAESAARSADEISKLIHEIEADTRNVADEMRESSQVISEGREDVNTIALSLEQIRSAVGEAAARAEEIFQEADNQARDAERMVHSTEEFSKVVASGASAVEDVAAISRRQLESMSDVVRASKALAELSQELRDVTRRFQTDRGEPA